MCVSPVSVSSVSVMIQTAMSRRLKKGGREGVRTVSVGVGGSVC